MSALTIYHFLRLLLIQIFCTFGIQLFVITSTWSISLKSPLSSRGLADLLDSQGYEHVNNVFPNAEDFSIAIAREWAAREDLHKQGKTGLSSPYLTCVRNDIVKEKRTWLTNLQIEHHVTYSSTSRDRTCFLLYATWSQVTAMESDQTTNTIVPVPHELKFDSSIAATLHWLHSSANGKIISAANNLDRTKSATSSLPCPIFSRAATLAALEHTDTSVRADASDSNYETGDCHPMIHALADDRDVELSVIFRSDMSFAQIHDEVKLWTIALGLETTNIGPADEHTATVIRSTTPSNSNHNIDLRSQNSAIRPPSDVRAYPSPKDRSDFQNRYKFSEDADGGSSSPFSRSRNFRKSRISQRTANSRLMVVPHYVHYDLRHENFDLSSNWENKKDLRAFHNSQERKRDNLQAMWSAIQSDIDELQSRLDIEIQTECKWDQLFEFVRFRKRSVSLTLPKGSLSGSQSAGCFALLASTIASSHQVVRLATSLPINLGNDFARATTQSGTMTNQRAVDEPMSVLGLNGTGEVIGISDSGLDELSCFFYDYEKGNIVKRDSRSTFEQDPYFDLSRRKVVQYVAYTSSGSGGDWDSGHGSHTSGTLAGECYDTKSSMTSYNGMAAGAKLAFFDIGQREVGKLDVPFDMAIIFRPAYAAGSRLHSNSWGGGYWYDSYCLEVDEFLFENDDFMAVFAAGNDGSMGRQSILSPGLSKNAVAATSSMSHPVRNTISSFASAGPAPDGRIKPDVVAPGDPVTSVYGRSEGSQMHSCSTTGKTGTSMATPVVGGTSAIVRQYFRDPRFWASLCDPSYPSCKNGVIHPKGSLLKGILVHSGTTMAIYNGVYSSIGKVTLNTLPDGLQGYGRVTLNSALPTLPAASSPFSLFVDQVNMTDFTQLEYDVTVTSSSTVLKATICWYDPPNEVFAARVLLNDIDLILVDPEGTPFFGNADSRSGVPPAGSVRDEINNVEQVTITSPALGVWKVYVQAKLLSGSAKQLVSIIITSGGMVSGTGLLGQPKPLNAGDLNPCASSGFQQVAVSKWDLGTSTHSSAWATGTMYTISDINGTLIQQGTDKLPYDVDNVCLPVGCYDFNLILAASQTAPTVQASISSCNIRVAPLVPTQRFCLLSPTPMNFSNYLYYPEVTCVSSCSQNAHYQLRLELFEGGGVGWEGAYYALHRLDDTGLPDSSIASRAVGAGTLEWGFGEYTEVCIPKGTTCYVMEVSIPSATDGLDPILIFRDAKLHNPDGSLSDIECPYILHDNVTFAKICVNDLHSTARITFLGQAKAPTNFGQTTVDWATLSTKFNQQVPIGTCGSTLLLSTIATTTSPTEAPFDTPPPSVEPRPAPTRRPHTLSPTQQPIVQTSRPTHPASLHPTTKPIETVVVVDALASYNYSCFASCSPNEFLFYVFQDKYRQSACDYLISIYGTCGTFSTSEGTCARPACAASCDAETWCFYGTRASLFCPYDSWNSNDNLPLQLSMQHECLDQLGSIAIQEETDQYKASNSKVSPVETVDTGLIVAVVVLGLFVVGFGVYLGKLLIKRATAKEPFRHAQLSTVSDDSAHGYAVDVDSRNRGIELTTVSSPIGSHI